MSSRTDGSDKFPHTDADEAFNNLMAERDRVDELPRSVAKVALRSVEKTYIYDPITEVVAKVEAS